MTEPRGDRQSGEGGKDRHLATAAPALPPTAGNAEFNGRIKPHLSGKVLKEKLLMNACPKAAPRDG